MQRVSPMHRRLSVPFACCLLALAATGCDLVSEPGGPRPEDFELEEDTSEVRTAGEDELEDEALRHDVTAPLGTARSGVSLSVVAPR